VTKITEKVEYSRLQSVVTKAIALVNGVGDGRKKTGNVLRVRRRQPRRSEWRLESYL